MEKTVKNKQQRDGGQKDIREDTSGEMIVSTILHVLVIVIFLLLVIEALSYVVQYQKVMNVADQLTREVELTGDAASMNALLSAYNTMFDTGTGTTPANKFSRLGRITASVGNIQSGEYGSTSYPHIQWMSTFEVQVETSYRLNYFTFGSLESGNPAVSLSMPIRIRRTGMSEVYFK